MMMKKKMTGNSYKKTTHMGLAYCDVIYPMYNITHEMVRNKLELLQNNVNHLIEV